MAQYPHVALNVQLQWGTKILHRDLEKRKTAELRGCHCVLHKSTPEKAVRVWLKWQAQVWGYCYVVHSEYVTREELKSDAWFAKHRVKDLRVVPYPNICAWFLKDVHRLLQPLKVEAKPGGFATTWSYFRFADPVNFLNIPSIALDGPATLASTPTTTFR